MYSEVFSHCLTFIFYRDIMDLFQREQNKNILMLYLTKAKGVFTMLFNKKKEKKQLVCGNCFLKDECVFYKPEKPEQKCVYQELSAFQKNIK